MCTRMTGARQGLLWSNILLMVIALTFIAGGIVLIIGRSVYGSQLDFLEDDLSASAAAIRGNTNLDLSDLDVKFITLPLGITLMVSGVLIVAVGILGIIAASGNFYKFIIVYMSLLAVLYFTQIVVIICAYIDRDPFDSTVKEYLKDGLDAYTNIDGEDDFTLGWNAIMSYFQCCGVDDYTDFAVAGYPTTVETPQICCIDKTNAPACAQTANFQTDTYFNRGCYIHMWDHVTSYTALIICAVFGIVFLEFLCLFFALWLMCGRRSQGPSKVHDYYNDYN